MVKQMSQRVERCALHGQISLTNMVIMLELMILTIVGIQENLKKEYGAFSVQQSLKTVELELVVGNTFNNLSCNFFLSRICRRERP